ncbi:unnamed protein product [Hydatigera taeniaeformis]|uniref:TPH domain-containing protein n=1 Tax=Hydatigena taeniaeformis TaxID=6205 RepID=A0A0R3X388_HYDTA|nr:unnamed protein product [Hydatigera taeniaeformis]
MHGVRSRWSYDSAYTVEETIDGKTSNCVATLTWAEGFALSCLLALPSLLPHRHIQVNMIFTELERVYDAWRRRDQVQRQKSIFNTRIRTAMNDISANLEARRAKLEELFRREKAENMATCSAKLHAEETARKEALIAEAAVIKEQIKTKNAEVAEREYQRLIHLSSDEYRLCRPKLYKRDILVDQKAIDEFKKQKRAYEEARDKILTRQNDGISCKLIEADSIRIGDKKAIDKKHRDLLLQQIAEREAKRKLDEELKAKDSKEMEETMKTEAELQKQETLQKTEAKQRMSADLKNQIQAVKMRLKKEDDENSEFDKAILQNWSIKEVPNADRRERLKGLNREAKHFLDYQKQVRDHRKCLEAEADKHRVEAAEQYHRIQQEREKARRCFVQQLNRETFEAHKAALDENAKLRTASKAQRLEEERHNLREDKRQEEEMRRALETAAEIKRKTLRASLMEQLEERCLRRKQEAEEVEKEKAVQRLADEAYQRRMKNFVCDEKMWDEYSLHPWRRMGLKRTA